MSSDFNIYAGQRVLVTGHTGFKGAWLCEWLLGLGAEVHGWALSPLKPSLFEALSLEKRLEHEILDITNVAHVQARMAELKPAFIFHLAAQALVRVSYREPKRTFATNTLGTAHVLEAVRAANFPCSVVVVTTDKCYENDGRARNFKESDPLGGHDPYSASKAAAELVVASYRDSFFSHGMEVALASARAGNVIGGGDWSEDRLVPDCIRALSAGQPAQVRNPAFTRPWQHVLEPLGGYLLLGAKLEEARRKKSAEEIARFAQAFNFGPDPEANRTVRDLIEEVLRHWPGKWEQAHQEKHLKEAPLLSLAIDKAQATLGWKPRWNFAETVAQTVAWYHDYFARSKKNGPPAMADFTRQQIEAYSRL
ncbi:MAG TPA: CDP-glucose 4,6-dehydratase [Candidatus Methylacidiphilales bacterium]|nr:CDP-glucose 4,6-dehydratase [Candidatus Methylacidiphilales bacterium]